MLFNESRGRIQWLIRKSPMIRNNTEQKDVDISGIFTASAGASSIRRRPSNRTAQFASSTDDVEAATLPQNRRPPYLRPLIPTTQVQAILNMDPAATWPE